MKMPKGKRNEAEKVKAEKVKAAPVLFLRDYWDMQGVRHKKDDISSIPTDEARTLLDAGKVERADPLPGEE